MTRFSPNTPSVPAFVSYLQRTGMLLAIGLVLGCTSSTIATDAVDAGRSTVEIRRPALWVPDLDRAIEFYRDVLGFQLAGTKDLKIKDDSVLLDMFNAAPADIFRRALFSSTNTENAIFVMESADAPKSSEGQPRPAALVIKSNDVAAIVTLAHKHGFVVGNTNIEPAAVGDRDLLETTIVGPGAQVVLVYQLID